MIRTASDRTLRALTLARLIGNYPAAALAVVLVAQFGPGWVHLPAWSLWTWGAILAVALILGHLADVELAHRDDETEREDTLGHWPNRAEREAWDADRADEIRDRVEAHDRDLLDEPVQVDDDGEPVR